jgi:glycosyltransferase involved in cell wall biosynthesis
MSVVVVPPGESGLYPPWLPRPSDARVAAARADRLAAAARAEALAASPFRRIEGAINVGFVGTGYWPLGGTERWHQVLLPRLAAMKGVHVVGYALGWESTGPAIPGVPIANGGAAVRSLLALSDVAVCWGLADLAKFLGPRRPKLVGVSHGSAANAWNVEVTTALAPLVDVRAAVSRHAACAWGGGPDGVLVIPNGADPATLRPSRPRRELRAALGLEDGEVACLAVGWVSEGKRVELAAAAVRRLGPPFRLLVAGDGPRKGGVAEAGGDRVSLLGRRDDVADLMAAADLLVHPSASEGMALVHIEAAFARLPIVSTPVGHLADEPELARIVPLDAGPAGWARAIASDWAEGTARRQRVVLARATAEADCTADVFAGRWAALLRSLAPARPVEPPAPPAAPRAGQGRQAVASLAAARSCPHRVELTDEERAGCGCRGSVTARCAAGKSRREDQRVSLGECMACVGAG